MYILYANISGLKVLDYSNNEDDIIETLEQYIKSDFYGEVEYLIELKEDNQSLLYKLIKNKNEFEEYKQEKEANSNGRKGYRSPRCF